MKLERNQNLPLEQCPYCGVRNPLMSAMEIITSADNSRTKVRTWALHNCSACAGVTLAECRNIKTTVYDEYYHFEIDGIIPAVDQFSITLPQPIRRALEQASETLAQPELSIISSSRAVDLILQERGLTDDSTLHQKLEKAVGEQIITPDMFEWAKHVRLQANRQRHPSDDSTIPDRREADSCLFFAKTIADVLLVVPETVSQAIAEMNGKT